MKQRMSKNVDVIEKAFEQSDGEGEPENHNKDEGEPEVHNKEISRLFVRNLAFSCTDEELADLFKPFGEISQVSFFFISYRTYFFVRNI